MKLDSEDLAGILFVVFGVGTIVLGWSYGLGTMTQLGSGAIPVTAGGALLLLGIAQIMKARLATRSEPVSVGPAFNLAELRPLLVIMAAVFAFATLILPAGLVPALMALIAISWFAQKGGARWELFGAMALVIVMIIAIFKYGLGLPLRLFVWGV